MAQFVASRTLLPAEQLEAHKFEIASELGIPLRSGDNGDLSTRDAGRIGGRIGGPIVKVLIRRAEELLASGQA